MNPYKRPEKELDPDKAPGQIINRPPSPDTLQHNIKEWKKYEESRKQDTRPGPDGYSTWEKFRAELSDRDDFFSWSPDMKDACHINTKDGGCVSLKKDGTWSYDCAPDWDGSS